MIYLAAPCVLALAVLAAPAAPADGVSLDTVLPFVADDYGKALTEARTQKLPLFVEAWAPW